VLVYRHACRIGARNNEVEEMIMFKPIQTIAVCLTICLLTLGACQKQEPAVGEKGAAEKAGQQIDQAAVRAGEEINKAAEKAGKGLQELGQKIQNEAQDAQQAQKKD
jgi:hypothetical protein